MKRTLAETDYKMIHEQAEAVIEEEPYYVAALSNIAALLYMSLDEVNWAGFYLMNHGSLLVGPFQGKPACMRIEVGKGVCGTAVKEGRILRVADVHEFPGHIACDAASRSEIVLPIRSGKEIVGVLDIDSTIPDRFNLSDEQGLSELAQCIGRKVDFHELC